MSDEVQAVLIKSERILTVYGGLYESGRFECIECIDEEADWSMITEDERGEYCCAVCGEVVSLGDSN